MTVVVAGLAAGCGSDRADRAERFCARWAEQHGEGAENRDKATVLSDSERLVRTAPYEIADDMAVVAATERAGIEGTGPVVGPEALERAVITVAGFVEETCD